MLTEMFKTKSSQNPECMLKVFHFFNNHYILRYNNEFLQPKVKTISYVMETIRIRGRHLWQTLPTHIEILLPLKTLYRSYIPSLGVF